MKPHRCINAPPTAHRSPLTRHAAFTLIEMLVVIAIIAVLAALLFPTLGGAKEKAQRSKCMGNLRQWATAMNLYLADHGGEFPSQGTGGGGTADPSASGPANAWFKVLPPYVEETSMQSLYSGNKMPRPGDKSIFICPSAKREATIPSSNKRTYYANYAQNLWLEANKRGCANDAGPTGYGQYLRISQLQNLSSFAMMAESPTGVGENGQEGYLYGHGHVWYMGWPKVGDAFRHNGSANIAFADGHVASYLKSQVYIDTMNQFYNYGGIQWNPDNPNLDGACSPP